MCPPIVMACVRDLERRLDAGDPAAHHQCGRVDRDGQRFQRFVMDHSFHPA